MRGLRVEGYSEDKNASFRPRRLSFLTSVRYCQNMPHTLITVFQFIAGAGALACWTLGMYIWYLHNYAAKPGMPASQRRQRIVLSFVAMAVLGLVAWGLRMFKESVATV